MLPTKKGGLDLTTLQLQTPRLTLRLRLIKLPVILDLRTVEKVFTIFQVTSVVLLRIIWEVLLRLTLVKYVVLHSKEVKIKGTDLLYRYYDWVLATKVTKIRMVVTTDRVLRPIERIPTRTNRWVQTLDIQCCPKTLSLLCRFYILMNQNQLWPLVPSLS